MRIRCVEVMVRTVAGFGILCSTSPVIAQGRRGISLMARARGPGRREGGERSSRAHSQTSKMGLRVGQRIGHLFSKKARIIKAMFQNITLGICTVKTLFYRCYQFGEASKFEEYNRITAAGCLLKMLKMVQSAHIVLNFLSFYIGP